MEFSCIPLKTHRDTVLSGVLGVLFGGLGVMILGLLVWALASGEEGAVFYTPFLLIYGAPCWLIGFAGILSAL